MTISDTFISKTIGALVMGVPTLIEIMAVDVMGAAFKIGITAVAAVVGGFLGALGKHFFHRWILKDHKKKKK